MGQKLDDLAADLDRLASLAKVGATTRDLLTAVRDDIGLGSAMTLLDSSGGASGSHLDDLEALLQVADLHPDAGSFEAWLRRTFHRERAEGGVTLSTIHRVKGREWDRVVVFGATEGLMPHRLSTDVEEERRILHVGITRGRERVLVLGDRSRRSPFLAELDGSADAGPGARGGGRRCGAGRAAARKAPAGRTTLPAEVGQTVKVLGGYEGVIEVIEDAGVRLRLDDGGSFFIRFGERITVDGTPLTLARPPSPVAVAAGERLRAWRLERSKADGVPAYVVLSDKHLDGIAERHPTSLAELRACPASARQARVLRRRDPRGPPPSTLVAHRRHAVAHTERAVSRSHRPVGHAEPGRVDQQDRRHDADGDGRATPAARVGPACTGAARRRSASGRIGTASSPVGSPRRAGVASAVA